MQRWIIIFLLCISSADANAWRLRSGTGLYAEWAWEDSETVDSFIVYCGLSAGGARTISHDYGNVLRGNLVDQGLVDGVTYYCVVRAVLGGIESEDSNEISVCVIGRFFC